MTHYVESVFYDNIGEGIRMECICGHQTCPCQNHSDAGEEFDDHLKEVTNADPS